MNIGISCYPTHGGSGVVATELGHALARRGHQVAFVSYKSPLRLCECRENISFHEVPIESYPLLEQFPYTLALASKMAEVARNRELDVLHAHYAIPFTAAALLAKQMIAHERDLKVITTLHGTDITLVGRNASFKAVTEHTIQASDAVTAVSDYLKQETYDNFSINDKPIEVIHNFIDVNKHLEAYNSRKSPEKPTLIHISNFRPVKRIADVVKTFAKVRESVDARLILVGDGPEACVVRQLCQELHVCPYVEWAGVVDKVEPLLQRADCLLLPSQHESFGLVALEAMATGVPVVASRAGGIPEVIEHGVSGYLADVGDVDTMARGVLAILKEKDNNNAFVQGALTRAKHFDEERLIGEYEALYERTIHSTVVTA